MPSWRDGLVDAFPIPDDDEESEKDVNEITQLEDALNATSLSEPTEPFSFFGLPPELRIRIYNYILFSPRPRRRRWQRRKAGRLTCMLVNRRMHDECAYVLYTAYRFKIFHVQSFGALPTVDELPPHYRALVTGVEMNVGSSWTAIPPSWKVTRSLAKCLKSLKHVQTLRVFVDFDPSHPAFKGLAVSDGNYTDFCGELLEDVLDKMPRLRFVELDGNPGVDVHGPLVTRLRGEVKEAEKQVIWGKDAGWVHKILEELEVKQHRGAGR